MALAYEGAKSHHTDLFAVEAFLVALNDYDLADKIREFEPVDLDEAVRHARRLESYGQCRKVNGGEEPGRNTREKDGGHVRAVVSEDSQPMAQVPAVTTAVVKEQVTMSDLQKIHMEINALKEASQQRAFNGLTPMTNMIPSGGNSNGMYYNHQQYPAGNYNGGGANEQNPSDPNWISPNYRGRDPRPKAARKDPSTDPCYRCRQLGHWKNQCPNPAVGGRSSETVIASRSSLQIPARSVQERKNHVVRPSYLELVLHGVPLSCLLDTGCDQSVVPERLTHGMRVNGSSKRLFAANGTNIPVRGEVILPIRLQGVEFEAVALVSPEVNEIMLGLDWMSQHDVYWDTKGGRIMLQGQWFNLHAHPERLTCRRVILQSDVVIPPKSQVIVHGKYNLNGVVEGANDGWMTEATETRNGSWVACADMPPREENLPVLLLNTDDATVSMEKGGNPSSWIHPDEMTGLARTTEEVAVVPPLVSREVEAEVEVDRPAVMPAAVLVVVSPGSGGQGESHVRDDGYECDLLMEGMEGGTVTVSEDGNGDGGMDVGPSGRPRGNAGLPARYC